MPFGDDSFHRKSVAWQKGMDLATVIYKITANFPSDERFGLTNQLRRASVSIPSNIAEGKGRIGPGELIQFLSIARGSTLEVLTQLELASRLGYSTPAAVSEAQKLADEVLRILTSSLATLRAKATNRK